MLHMRAMLARCNAAGEAACPLVGLGAKVAEPCAVFAAASLMAVLVGARGRRREAGVRAERAATTAPSSTKACCCVSCIDEYGDHIHSCKKHTGSSKAPHGHGSFARMID